MSRHFLRVAAAALAVLVIGAVPASAHPHVWVLMKSEIVFAPDGTVRGIRHAWTFDDMFSTFAIQGIESKKRGVFTREELAPLAKTNVESLKEFDYFTLAKVNGKPVDFGDPPNDYYLEYKDEVLTLHMMLPFKTPIKARNVDIEVYDPSYFVDFSFSEKNPVSMVSAPAQCKLTVTRPGEPTPGSQRLDESKLFKPNSPDNMGAQFASRIFVRCS